MMPYCAACTRINNAEQKVELSTHTVASAREDPNPLGTSKFTIAVMHLLDTGQAFSTIALGGRVLGYHPQSDYPKHRMNAVMADVLHHEIVKRMVGPAP